ncbi:MAG: glycogen/starch synthase [Bacteroidaceae bacterium]|nr:glycogen/starch synthase [Bacteroidaceae bacterium]
MKAKKVLFITQEITPYVPESTMSTDGRYIPQKVQESGREIRTFMPRWGNINERRNQLHEVIRLSGMNIIIDDTDNHLIIKVASIQPARMQVYFIDNDDYFHKRLMKTDEDGKEYEDNMERAIFYARGVLETVKKLRWTPEIVNCQGWMSAIVPLYIKTAFREDPPFAETKVVFNDYNDYPQYGLGERFAEELAFRGASVDILKSMGIDLDDPLALRKIAIAMSDGYVQCEADMSPELVEFAHSKHIPVLEYAGEENKVERLNEFYELVMGE